MPVVIAALLATAPAVTWAQSGTSLLIGVGSEPGETEVSDTTIPVSASGELWISFHGDAASGCASYGLCGYSGTVVLRPGSDDQIAVVKFRGRHGVDYQSFLSLAGGPTELTATAQVRRTVAGRPAGLCGDEQQNLSSAAISISGQEAAVSLLQSDGTMLSTRCAGPLDGDLAAVSPAASLPLSTLLRGRTSLSLGGTRSFATHGFAGELTSTITLALGKPHTVKASSSPSFPKGIKTQPVRTVTERLSVLRTSGAITAGVQGTANTTVCGLLDSCGLSGTLTLTPAPVQSGGELSAMGPATRPYRDFLAALGLGRTGNPRGITVAGTVDWGGGGTAAEDLTQSGSCTDNAPLGPGGVLLEVHGPTVSAELSVFAGSRTRCPGPILDTEALASGRLPRADLAHRTFTVQTRAAGSTQDDGYVAELSGALTIQVRRGALSSRVEVQPVG